MTSFDIQEQILIYLRAEPSIKKCLVTIKPHSFLLTLINDTSIEIDEDINESFLKSNPTYFFSLLIEAGVKDETVKDLSTKLRQLRHSYFESLKGLNFTEYSDEVRLLNLNFYYVKTEEGSNG